MSPPAAGAMTAPVKLALTEVELPQEVLDMEERRNAYLACLHRR